MSDYQSPFNQANGKMPYMLVNDYLFRATLQKSNKALKGLICALLHKKPEEIVSVEITNPIELGKCIEAKNFILDIRVLLDGNEIINLEMQVINYGNWPERSLGYLCRSFDHLNSGQDYEEVKSVHQISFLDFTLFPEEPEFYAKQFSQHKLMGKNRACTNFYPLIYAEGAPSYEQKELRSSEKHRRCDFANGAAELYTLS